MIRPFVLRQIGVSAISGLTAVILARPAHAAGSNMPWEQPLQQILQSIEGPVAKIMAVIIIIITGLTLAFGDSSGGFRRLVQIVLGLSIASPPACALAKLDKYHLLILDDIVYVSKDQAETSVLFELIGCRYERRSMLITANQPFGEWGKVFPDQAMTLAAIDRLVHHATIFEMNVESYRRRAALNRKHGPGRPPAHATIKEKR